MITQYKIESTGIFDDVTELSISFDSEYPNAKIYTITERFIGLKISEDFCYLKDGNTWILKTIYQQGEKLPREQWKPALRHLACNQSYFNKIEKKIN